jgi:hypothetical protein
MANLKWIPPMLGGIALGVMLAVSPLLGAPAPPEGERVATAPRAFGALAPSAEPSRAATRAAPVTPSRRHSAEERRRDVTEAAAAQAARVERHRQEPRDPVWASAMENQIDGFIRGQADAGLGSYEGTDCRTKSCVIDFSWSSFAEAQADLQSTLRRIGPLPCPTVMAFSPDDAGGSGRFGSSVYVDCEASRAPVDSTRANSSPRSGE